MVKNSQEKDWIRRDKQREKVRSRRHKRIENGLNLCLVAACFLAFLTAAIVRAIEDQDAGKMTK